MKVPMIFGFNSEEGIINTADFTKNNDKFHELNEDWDYYGPRKIFDTDNASAEEIELARWENLTDFFTALLDLVLQSIIKSSAKILDIFSSFKLLSNRLTKSPGW